MAKRKFKKRRNKPAKKRTAVSPPPDTTQVVADIVHSLTDKKFGAKLSKKDRSRTKGKRS